MSSGLHALRDFSYDNEIYLSIYLSIYLTNKLNIPGTWPLGSGSVQVAMPAQHRLRLLEPAVGDRRRGVRDPGEAEVVFCAP